MIEMLAYFFAVMLAMGFAVWRLLGAEEEDDGSKIFLWLASGIVVFVLATVVLGFIGQANWFSYLILAAVLLAAAYWKDSKAGVKYGLMMPVLDLGWKLVCVIFLVHLYVYASGAFSYPWLEDDDPWEHAAATHYVSLFGSYIQPTDLPLHYLAPYTPFYDVLMGVLFQLDNSSMQFVLKFFNALLISLAIPLFYCWARGRFGARTALWATLALAALPAFMSHFIWAQSLSLMLVFPALYFVERYTKAAAEAPVQSNAFGILAALSIAAVFMTQPSTGAMFGGLMVAYIVALALPDIISSHKLDLAKLKPPATALGLGLLISIVLVWGPMFAMYPADQVFSQNSLSVNLLTNTTGDTGGGLVYGLNDFVDAPTASKIDQPTGFGPAAFLLLIMGVVAAIYALRSQENRENAAIMLLWLAYGFVGTEGNLLPVKLVPHRFWVFLAIPVAILAGYGAVKALEYVEKNRKGMETVAKALIVAALLFSSAYPKGIVETSQWPPGANWVSGDQLSGYVNLMNLPAGTKIFGYCMGEKFADGVDLSGYPWIKEVNDYKTHSINDSVDTNYAFLKKYGYGYAVIDQSCLKTFTGDQINAKLTALGSDSRFTIAQQYTSQTFFTLKIN
jgi:asparagine N-glycosylation enzyme membrane subunit Stt3